MNTTRSMQRGLALLLVASGLSACATRNWYEGVRMSAKAECNRMEGAARQDCLARVNDKSYDDYEKERSQERGANKP